MVHENLSFSYAMSGTDVAYVGIGSAVWFKGFTPGELLAKDNIFPGTSILSSYACGMSNTRSCSPKMTAPSWNVICELMSYEPTTCMRILMRVRACTYLHRP
eukprot:2751412-Rhodomonas_salina.3